MFGSPYHQGQKNYAARRCGQVNFLLPGNSWGKTEFIARDALWRAWHKVGAYQPDNPVDWCTQRYLILVCSYNYGVAKESFARLVEYMETRPEVAALIAHKSEQDSELTLANGAVIKWGSLDDKGKLVEAKRTQHIYVDEVGHIPDLATTYDNVLYPRTLGVAGVIDFVGTPKAYSDPYLLEVYEKGRDGGDGFYFSYSGAVLENEYWPDAEKDRVLANPRFVTGWEKCPGEDCDAPICLPAGHPTLTPVGRQVLLGHFVIEGGLFFNRFHVRRIFAWDGEEPEWLGTDHFAFKPQPGHLYAAAFDLAGNKLKRKGQRRGADPTVGFVVDYTTKPWRIVRFDYIRAGDADWEEKYQTMKEVYTSYHLDYLIIDATGNLDSIQEALQTRGVEVEPCVIGGSSNKKLDMLRNLQVVMEMQWIGEDMEQRGCLRSPLIPKLKHELEHYILPDDHIEQDCVMALAMVCWHISQFELPESTSGEIW